jgi:hypothetical protein
MKTKIFTAKANRTSGSQSPLRFIFLHGLYGFTRFSEDKSLYALALQAAQVLTYSGFRISNIKTPFHFIN